MLNSSYSYVKDSMKLPKFNQSKFLILISFIFIIGYILYSPQMAFAAEKKVEVNLTKQRLYVFEDGKVIYNFAISSGRTRTPTPVGNFKPRIKITSHTMKGGSKKLGNYYYLPKVPYSVYFHGGYAIHGTYWHSNFGRPMSHGCINMRTAEAKLIYNWIDTSTPINIYGTTPRS